MTKKISSEKKWTAKLPLLMKSMGVGLTLALLTINSLPVFASSGVVRKIVMANSTSFETASLKRGWDAEAARLTAEAAFYTSGLYRGWAAEGARLTAEAASFTSTALTRGWVAEAARLTAEGKLDVQLASSHGGSKALLDPAPDARTAASLQRGWAAESARLTAEAHAYFGK